MVDQRYIPHFQSGSRSVGEQAEEYLQGLFQASRKKNMERMVEVVPDCNYQSLQHFLSHSQWDARAVLNHVAAEADRRVGSLVYLLGSPKAGEWVDSESDKR